MAMSSLDSKENQRFWQGNQAAYQGDRNAAPLLRLARRHVGDRVLDAGAGSGSLVREIRRVFPGATVLGVDLAPKSEDVVCADLTCVPCADATFDTVFCSEVIEHLSPATTGRVFAEIRRVTRNGGSLVLTTPYREVLADDTVTCPKCGETFHRWGHQQSFDVCDLKAVAEAHGFAVESVAPVKMKRVRRFGWLGVAVFAGPPILRNLLLSGAGDLNLVMFARKRGQSTVAGGGRAPV